MGKIIVKRVKGMNLWAKFALVTLCTLVVSIFMYEGWYKPRTIQAAVTLVTGGALNGTATNGGNITLTFPGGVQQGDIVILYGGHPYRAATNFGPSTAGYTAIASYNTATTSFGAWYKVMGSTPDTQVIGFGTGNAADGTAYAAYILRGIDAAIFDQTTTTAGPTPGTNPNSPAITTQTDGAWVLALAGSNVNDASPGTIAGYGNVNGNTANDNPDFSTYGATLEKATAGSEDPAAWSSWSTGTWYAITIALKPADVTPPSVTFTVPATSNSLTVSGINLSATDAVGVTGYLINESATPPSAAAVNVTPAPTTYTAASVGAKTLYGWARDAAGNVSAVNGQPCNIDITAPTVDTFSVPATSSSLTISGITFTASDDVSVTGYLVNESAIPPAAAAITLSTAPTTYTAGSEGAKTLYAWVKDASGKVNNVFAGQTCTITLPDSIAPTVDAFTVPVTSSSLTVTGISLTASDNIAVTGYLINESSTAPAAVDIPTTGTSPTSYTAGSAGAKTLYAWVKDAAGNVNNAFAGQPCMITVSTMSPLLHNSQNTGSTKWTADGGWGVLDGKYGQFTCDTCHNKTTENIKQVVESIPDTIGPTVVKTVTFNNMTGFGDESVAHATSVGICEVCHTQTTSHRYDNTGQTARTHSNGDCTECHFHANGFRANVHIVPLFATTDGHTGCASGIGCHNNSNPAAAYPAVPTGSAPDCRACHTKGDPLIAAGNGCGSCHGAAGGNGEPSGTVHPDAAGSHAVHTPLTTCINCHDTGGSGSGANHGEGNKGANPAVVNLNAALGVSGSDPNLTCATVACHDNGKGVPAVTPAWGAASVPACTACHALIPADNSHNKHVTTTTFKKALCADCHTGYVQGTTAAANHLNTTIEVNTGGYTSPKAKGSTVSSCATSYCHSSGQSANGASATPVYAITAPTWGGTVACGSCHATTGMSTGSHAKHFTGISPSTNCGNCHTDATAAAYASTSHVNQLIDVNSGYTAGGAPGNGYGTCTAASCHDNGKGVPAETPAWGAASVPACTACHALIPADNSHNKHVTTTTFKKALCADCHTGYVQGTTAAANHLNTTIEVNTGGYTSPKAKGSAVSSCATSYCHSSGQSANGASATPVYATTAPTWGGTVACGSCHATTGMTTGSHAKHITSDSNCGNCHTGAAVAAYANTAHVDGQIEVNSGYTAGGAPGNGYGTCATASCHNDGTTSVQPATPQWGDTAAACAACHAASPTTGSHSRHMTTTLRQGVLSIVCADCHTSGAPHLDGTVDVIPGSGYPQDITKHAVGSYTGSCTTVYCHSNGNTAARTITYKPISWGAAQLDCEGCHLSSGLTAGHAVHISTLLTERKSTLSYSTYSANASNGTIYKFGCANCHPVTPANHLNGSVDVNMATTAGSGTLKGKNPGTASYDMADTKKCANVYCHSNGYAANLVYTQSPVWTGTFTGDKCAACHGNSPSTTIAGSNAHKKHVVGIHYTDIYNDPYRKVPEAAAKGGAINAAHGTESRSTTLNCNLCHNDTILTSANDNNTVCITCHTTGNLKNPASLISNTAFHVNGQVNVKFADTKITSKAQVNNASFKSYTAATEGGWSRNNGLYKNFTSAYDVTKTTLFNSASFTAGDCTNVACHAGKSVTWTATDVSCSSCHKRL